MPTAPTFTSRPDFCVSGTTISDPDFGASGSRTTSQGAIACDGVDLYLDQQAIDTTTPMAKLVFQLTGVKLGRPKVDRVTERKVRRRLRRAGPPVGGTFEF